MYNVKSDETPKKIFIYVLYLKYNAFFRYLRQKIKFLVLFFYISSII